MCIALDFGNHFSERCQCGRDKMWHIDANIDVSTPDRKVDWEATDAFTRTYTADTFGTIVFQGFGQESTRACPVIHFDAFCSEPKI